MLVTIALTSANEVLCTCRYIFQIPETADRFKDVPGFDAAQGTVVTPGRHPAHRRQLSRVAPGRAGPDLDGGDRRWNDRDDRFPPGLVPGSFASSHRRATVLRVCSGLLRAVTVEVVARSANVARVTLCRHFPSGNELPGCGLNPDSGRTERARAAVAGFLHVQRAQSRTTAGPSSPARARPGIWPER